MTERCTQSVDVRRTNLKGESLPSRSPVSCALDLISGLLLTLLCLCTFERSNPYDPDSGKYQPLKAPEGFSATFADSLTRDTVLLSWTDNNTHEYAYLILAGADSAGILPVDTLDSNSTAHTVPLAGPDTVWFAIGVLSREGNPVQTAALKIEKSRPPNIVLTYSLADDSASIGDVVRLFFTATDTPFIAGYTWHFNRGSGPRDSATPGQSIDISYGSTPMTDTVIASVIDVLGDTIKDTAIVTIVLDPPTADAGPDDTVNLEASVTVRGTGANAFGTLSYAWKIGPDGAFETSPDGNRTFTAPNGVYVDYPCVLRVTDDDGLVAYDTLRLVVGKEWKLVGGGSPGRTVGSETTPYDLFVSVSGDAYLAYQVYTPEPSLSDTVWSVMASRGPWERIGQTIGIGLSPRISLVGNRPFVVYADWANAEHSVSAQHYDGTTWASYFAGNALSKVGVVSIGLHVHADVPYIAYIEDTAGYPVSVRTFDGSWGLLGAPRFFTESNQSDACMYVSTDNTPYVGCVSSLGAGYCYAYKGGNWGMVGGGQINPTRLTAALSLAATGDTCYVACAMSQAPLVVARAIGIGSWATMGTIDFRAATNVGIALVNNSLYVAYGDPQNENKVSVCRFINNRWEPVGGKFVTPSYSSRSIRLDTNGNMLYVASVYNVPPYDVNVYALR